MTNKIYFTIIGTWFFEGEEFFEVGMQVFLENELDNEYDNEAILVEMSGFGNVGYVANSCSTVIGDEIQGQMKTKF